MISRKGYYSNIDVQFELIYQQMHRETFFLPYQEVKGKLESTPPIRWLNASAIKFLKMHWERYNFLDKPMNMYHSLAKYKDFPTFSYNWRTKSQQQQIWLDAFKDRVTSYDLFIETDSPDLKIAHSDSVEIKKILDEHKVRYYINFSGSKGFHFIVPYEEFNFLRHVPLYSQKIESNVKNFKKFLEKFPIEPDDSEVDLVLLFKVIAHKIKMLYVLDTVDTSVQDVKRVKKTAYSWDVKSNLIALPLDDEQMMNFSKDIVRPENVIKAGVHKRRLLWRNTNIINRESGLKELLLKLGIFKYFK